MKILVIGATGSIGREVIAEARSQQLEIHALSRDPQASLLGCTMFIGDGTNPDDIKPALVDVDAVILTHGNDSQPEAVNYGVVAALLEALGTKQVHISLMSSINITQAREPYADLMNWKRRGERLLRASGLPYTIVRPGWFDNGSVTDQRIVFQQGDTIAMAKVKRKHVAQTLIAACQTPAAQGITLEVFSEPGVPVIDLGALFTKLQPDTPGDINGAHDPDNLPVKAGPQRVLDDLQRLQNG